MFSFGVKNDDKLISYKLSLDFSVISFLSGFKKLRKSHR